MRRAPLRGPFRAELWAALTRGGGLMLVIFEISAVQTAWQSRQQQHSSTNRSMSSRACNNGGSNARYLFLRPSRDKEAVYLHSAVFTPAKRPSAFDGRYLCPTAISLTS
jgi:hypothetical protein